MTSLGALFQSVTGWKIFVSQELTEVDGPEEAVSMYGTYQINLRVPVLCVSNS